jgi:hypothetical protein
MSPKPKPLPNPEDIKKFFESWWQTASTIIGTIVGALAVFQIPSTVAYAIAVPLVLGGIGLTIIIFRRESKRREKDARTLEAITATRQDSGGAAFRGLRRFRKGESLPGPQRRREAAQLLNQVTHHDFRIALVTGDSGSGKSSLLECSMVESLEKAGHAVVMISNAATLGESGGQVNVKDPDIGTIITTINRRIDNKFKSKNEARDEHNGGNVFIILDQFEELISRFREDNDRAALGEFLKGIIEEKIKVIIGIRKEYLVDFKSVAARLTFPVSFEDTFLINNFDLVEAIAVIKECAQRDCIAFDEDLPSQIAEDLSIEGRVRPADLQIVCTTLSGDLTLERYQSEGRAAGLRSRFIKEVIDITGDPVLARTVLRELCDMPNNKKLAEPLKAESIAEKARLAAPGARATVEAVNSVLQALCQARVVVFSKEFNDARWSLIHDYIVEPIKLATEEQTTRSESASARLNYFISRAKNDLRVIIPFQELRSIRRDAPPAALRQPAARKLIRRSLIIAYGKPIALTAGAVGASLLVFILVASERGQWRIVNIASHWDGAKGSPKGGARITANQVRLPDGKSALVVGTGFNPSDRVDRLTVWDPQTGDIIAIHTGMLNLSGDWLWSYDEATGRLARIQPGGKEEMFLVTPKENRPQGALNVVSWNDPVVTFKSDRRTFRTDFEAFLNLSKRAWSILEEKKLHPQLEIGSYSHSALDDKFFRAHVINKGEISKLTIFLVNSSEIIFEQNFNSYVRLLSVKDLGSRTAVTIIRDSSLEVLLLEKSSSEDLQANSIVSARQVVPIPDELRPAMMERESPWPLKSRIQVFETDHQLLIADNQQTRTVIWIFDPASMKFEAPIISAAPAVMIAPSNFGPPKGIAWITAGQSGPTIWLEGQATPFVLKGLQIGAKDEITISNDSRRMLVHSENGSGELWDIDTERGVALWLSQTTTSLLTRVFFSSDQQLVLVRHEGGQHSVWHRDGKFMGSLGTMGSDISWSIYHSSCRQVLIWNEEGQRLDLRRGFVVPIFGFIPERECNEKKSWIRPLVEPVLYWITD